MIVGWTIYAALVAVMAAVVVIATTDMWRSNDRPAAILFGSSFGAITLVLIFGPFIG